MTLSAEYLLNKARELTAIDIEDAEAQLPLNVLVNSLKSESKLSAVGAARMEMHLLRLLMNRLRMERDYKNHPEIEVQEIISPVFISSLPRTGSTKLQKLLSSMGEFTALPFWMGFNPALITGDRSEQQDRRIEEAQEFERWSLSTIPDIKHLHAYRAFEPEEPVPLLEHSLISSNFLMADVTSFLRWLKDFDPGLKKRLQYLSRVLKYLQWQFNIDNSSPWLLKTPAFLSFELTILEVFPDAKLIMTHRNPVAIIPSASSLVISYRKLFSEADFSLDVVNKLLDGQAALIEQHIKIRASNPHLKILDIAYPQLTNNSLDTMKDIFDYMGMPFTQQAQNAVVSWERQNAQHKHGVHHYKLSDVGLTKETINEKFERYISEFNDFF